MVQRNLGADSLAAWLGSAGYDVVRVASRRGYRILRVGHGTPEVTGDEPDPPEGGADPVAG